MTTFTVPVPGGMLHVIDDGDPADAPIVLLHAWIADLRAWDDMAPLLVASRYRVIRFDGRGFGRTTTDDVEYSPRADVIALLDALEISVTRARV